MHDESRQLELSLPWDCREPAMGRMLAAYDWGILSPGDEQQFEQHLLHCPACARELSTSWQVGASIRACRRHRPRFAWLSVGLAAAAAAVFVIIEFGDVMNPRGRPVDPGETVQAVPAPESASWTFELDIPNSNSFSYNLDIPGPS
jgi:hypothetical protein